MKRQKVDIKKRIKKKIELRVQRYAFIEKRSSNINRPIQPIKNEMNERDKLKIFGEITKTPINIENLTRFEQRYKIKPVLSSTYEIKDFGNYIKPKYVDYDVVIYISSYNRYEKLMRILNQLYTQKTKYTFKVVVLNDGSTDKRYENIRFIFPKISILRNKNNGGRALYWQTINRIFRHLKKYNTCAIIQIDDDFMLCNNFINILMNKFFELKKENNSYMGIRYHIGYLGDNDNINENYYNREKTFQGFDGGSLFDVQFMKMFDYKLNEIDSNIFKYKYQHSHVWSSLNDNVKKFGIMVYTIRESLVWHDGNEDSKMHPELRLKRNINTKNFIDDTTRNFI